MSYYSPTGGLPPQSQLMSATDRAVVTPAYTVIPKGCNTDIVTIRLPHWEATRVWVLHRPIAGFATTFSQYMVEVNPGGGSNKPDDDPSMEHALFITSGELQLTLDGKEQTVKPGHFAFIPPHTNWTLHNKDTSTAATFQWIRRRYHAVNGIDTPEAVIKHEWDVEPTAMPDTNGAWCTTRFVDPDDVRHDMHVTIVTLKPGAVIPFLETHVMEHGLFMLQGKGVYRLNQDWVEVEAGDFISLRAFCPQACYAGGEVDFRYLLYKDMHRHAVVPTQNG